jgi:hypothetical protein
MEAQAQESVRERLAAERALIIDQLSHVNDLAPNERMLNLDKGYGRIKEIEHQLIKADPEKLGYEAEMKRLQAEPFPRNMQQLDELLNDHQRRIMPFARAAALQFDTTEKGAINFVEYRYHQGAQQAISNWVPEHESRLKMAEILLNYADGKMEKEVNGKIQLVDVEHMRHELPVSAMARDFSNQLSVGNRTIDLSQTYATDSPEKAQEAHNKALGKLAEMIVEAREKGYTVNTGQAHLYAHQEREVMAVSEGYRI